MPKIKKLLLITIIILSFFFFFSTAYAVGQNQNSNSVTGNQIHQQTQTTNQGEDSQIQIQNTERIQSSDVNQIGTNTKTQIQQGLENGNGLDNQAKNQIQEQNTSTVGQQNKEKNKEQEQNQGQINAEQHSSAVANFVQSLLQVADREKGIGEQVRIIAQQQNQSIGTVMQAVEKVQTRGKVKTFFFGSDYKNLGTLRSEIVRTRNRLEQLNRLMKNVQNEGDRTELQNQIRLLEEEQVKIENFIKFQEGKFSLFGWLVKLFI